MNKLLKTLVLLVSTLQFSYVAAGDEVNTTFLGNLAIKGYDVVSYFTDNKATKGSKKNQVEYNGANYRFSSEANKKQFLANPEKYLPQFGGYCAYAVGAKNTTAGIDPTQFSIVDGKLYLNYNKKIQKKWLQKQSEYIDLGHKNWSGILEDLKD